MYCATIVFAASRAELETSLFDDPTFPGKAERFATDPGNMVAYVTKERNLRSGDDGKLSLYLLPHLPPLFACIDA